jgi:hypothetical protein
MHLSALLPRAPSYAPWQEKLWVQCHQMYDSAPHISQTQSISWHWTEGTALSGSPSAHPSLMAEELQATFLEAVEPLISVAPGKRAMDAKMGGLPHLCSP